MEIIIDNDNDIQIKIENIDGINYIPIESCKKYTSISLFWVGLLFLDENCTDLFKATYNTLAENREWLD